MHHECIFDVDGDLWLMNAITSSEFDECESDMHGFSDWIDDVVIPLLLDDEDYDFYGEVKVNAMAAFEVLINQIETFSGIKALVDPYIPKFRCN